jgi:hypothetical protein
MRRAGVEQASREETAAHGAVGARRYGDWCCELATVKLMRTALERLMPS